MMATRTSVTGPAQAGVRRRQAQSTGLSHRSIRSVTTKKKTLTRITKRDRRIGAGQVVALGEIVDQLAEAAEIDQELDADDVDQGEDQAEPDADENGRQRRREQDLR